MSIKINNKRFLKYVKNTIKDLKQNTGCDLTKLLDIYNSKELKLTNISGLYEVIYIRKHNYEYIKTTQDRDTFNLINNEHIFMENYFNKNFKYEILFKNSDNLFVTVSLRTKD